MSTLNALTENFSDRFYVCTLYSLKDMRAASAMTDASCKIPVSLYISLT